MYCINRFNKCFIASKLTGYAAMKGIVLTCATLLLLVGEIAAHAQVVRVGEVCRDFEITNRSDQSPLILSDYEGHVIVLDFFAWWCGPCRNSSPIVERDIYQYFKDQGGNDHGVPVTVIAVNIESDSPDRTDQFVQDAGLELVADDFEREAWNQFNEQNAIPLFVIMNGVNGNSDYEQWEVLYKKTGFEGTEKFRDIINRVQSGVNPPDPEEEAIELEGADISDFREVLDNNTLSLSVGPSGAKWFKDTEISSDGSDSLKSQLIINNSSTWVETSIKGPGFVFFQWRTSNDYGQDFSCYLGDELVATFERGFSWDEPNWLPSLTRVPAGQHTLKWVYSKTLANRLDIFGWLDDVQFYSEEEVLRDSVSAIGLDGATFEFGGQGMWIADKVNTLDGDGGLTSFGVGRNGRAWFQTTVEGPAYMEFHYKTPHSMVSGPSLLFSLDEKDLDLGPARMSSSHTDWIRSVVEIPEGQHQARWLGKNNVVIDLVKISEANRGAPVIIKPPTPVEISASGSALFEVEAMGYPFPDYQWSYSGVALEGKTDRVLRLNNLWRDHSGQVSVIVSNEFGAVESDPVDLSVNEDLDVELAEALDFDGRVVSLGKVSDGWIKAATNTAVGGDVARSFESSTRQSVKNTFAVRVEGPGYMKFQWRLDSTLKHTEDSIGSFLDDFSKTLSFLDQAAPAESSEWRDNWVFVPSGYHSIYFVFNKDSQYATTAYLDHLQFAKVQPGKPTFVDFPSEEINIQLGESLVLPIKNADGFPFPKFQWQVNEVDIPQANGSMFHLESAWDFDSADYSVVLSNQHGVIKSHSVRVNVVGDGNPSLAEGLDAGNLKFLNTGQNSWAKVSSSNSLGQDAVMSSLSDDATLSRLLTMVEGPGVLEFAWKIEGPDFDGGRLDFYLNDSEVSVLKIKSDWKKTKHFIASGKQKLEWTFRLGAMDIGEYKGYLDAVRFYTPNDSPPVLTIQPKGVNVEGVEDVSLEVTTEGWPIPELQWFHDGIPIKGANNERLPLGMIWPEDQGNYWVVAKNSQGEVRSDTATIKIVREFDEEIGLALDTDIYFVVGGMGGWKLQSNITSDGIDALKLGGLPLFDPAKPAELSFATLTTQLDGPGELVFKLKIKGEHQIFRAYLGEFSLWNSDYLTIRDTEINWEEHSLLIPEGNHMVRLMFVQGGPVKNGISSSVWIDELKYSKEEPPPPPEISIVNLDKEKFIVRINTEPGKRYRLETSGNLEDWETTNEFSSIEENLQIELPLSRDKQGLFFRFKTD